MSIEQKVKSSIRHKTPFRRHLLPLARMAWGVLVMLTIGLFVASAPTYFSSLHLPCAPAACEALQLTPDLLRVASRFSVDFYATSIVVLSLLLACGYIATGTVIFWHRPDDHMALLASFWLVTFASYLNDTMLKTLAPAW